MSFEATDLVPVEYQAIFNIISPLEKSGILKIIKQDYTEVEDNYEKFLFSLKEYLVKYQGEDISSLVFIMFSQIATDMQQDNLILEMLEKYPKSTELQFFKILIDVDKGIFEGIEKVLEKARLQDSERNTILTRLVAADKLARVILDLQSFALEMSFFTQKEEYDKIENIYQKAEEVWKRSVKWVNEKNIVYLDELASRLILQYTSYLNSAKGTDEGIKYFETPENSEVLNLCQSAVMKANVLHMASMLYYQIGQPNKATKLLEKAIKLHKKVHGRNSWKASFYHNLAYMYNIVDSQKCIEAYKQGLALLEGTEDYQSIATTVSNLIGLYTQMNKKSEARKYLMQLVGILEKSDELITPFRAYAVASNALSLDEYQLAHKYMEKLEEKVNQQPTLFNKAILSGFKMHYNLDAVINSEQAYMWGEESLYYFNKQKDYLNALGSVFNLVSLDFEFYKITWKDRYLNSARKRLNELFTLIGALKQPEFLANKQVILAGYEILHKNFDEADAIFGNIPEVEDEGIINNRKMMEQILKFAKMIAETEKENGEEEGEEDKKKPADVSTELIVNEIATNKDALNVFTMHLIEKTLQELVQLPQNVDPIKADIKLLLLMNTAGLTIYTQIFDTQKMNQQLISNFISAINSFGEQLFGTREPYFSFKRGDNTIIFQNINENLNLAIIVTQENYDAIMKLNTLSKEINEYITNKKIPLDKTLEEGTEFYKWLQNQVIVLMK
ncbi:MAG TPA: tetratricopeptide repeat protein [candidate division Zixibacteria bacterium]|nr:tetratricopeptide repeat protein [candidate division Zixibacteria bacterium]